MKSWLFFFLLALSTLAFSEPKVYLSEEKPPVERDVKTGLPTSPYSLTVEGEALPPQAQAMFISPDAVKELYNLKEGIDTSVFLLQDLAIASFPKVEALKAVKFISVHPQFQTVIIFDHEIAGASASFSTIVFRKQGNMLILQPSPDAYGGNITVLLKDPETEKPVVVSIIARKINPYRSEESGRKEIFYPVYYFAQKNILDGVQVLEHYRRVYGHYPQKEVETFFVDGVGYKIIQDEVHGNIRVGKRTYRVEVVRLRMSTTPP